MFADRAKKQNKTKYIMAVPLQVRQEPIDETYRLYL